MELRKCCNHPWLIGGAEEKEVPDGCTEHEYYEKTIQASGKMVFLHKLLPKLKRDGHKVLIFSQMKKVLDVLQGYLKHFGYLHERLDGGVTGNEREASIDRFNRKDLNRFVFLLSTRAGGVGLNLATADVVIIFDSDWNPQQVT
jgi:SNF2 family DNA or RNA helicase